MAKVCVPLAAGFEEIEAVSLIDVMRRGGIEVVVAGVNEDLVTGANGITVKADTDIKNVIADELDMIVLPGGWGGTHVLAENETVQQLLRDMQAKEKIVGAICAAPFALKQAGVLSEHYTCYPSVEEQIGKEGYTDSEKVVIDGNVMTSRGPGTAICFGLAIVRKLVGEETYQQLKEGLLADYC
ncbi:DJ-1 family glyoxalase III [Hydrogenimonas cancrithermarum]|uniref:4-methyl-5(B-hydroxyethyl)-thiazole monophosphate biosynthesis protein n=1 Tax=Hydrogenimonas cancrithermarum TaxID=2993563 RepID=A0ABN6WXD5_9BACT|nr:DJ-1 family glyoxalase III [Hydrogenimonas cancrithermarum]BDY13857.1 4-methyl-5(B-hydroxyethyl)-thiazole monophosphate biosynthesis protein [Hydrogenimonas cancrithermarum]